MTETIRKVLFIVSLLVGGITPVAAQNSAKGNETIARAEHFFEKCKRDPVISVNEDTDIAFCACAAANFQQWLEAPGAEEQIPLYSIVEKKPDGNALLTDIYGPCLHIPEYQLTYDECYSNRRHQYFANEPRRRAGLCGCIAQGVADYFERFAAPFLELKISEGEDIIDPVAMIKQDVNFYDAHYMLESRCYVDWANRE